MRDVGYMIEKIGPLPDLARIQARSLNNSGQVVGVNYYGVLAHDPGRAFFWSRGAKPVELQSFGYGSGALAINDFGDVIGWAKENPSLGLGDDDKDRDTVPIVWVGDRQGIPSAVPLRLPGNASGSAQALNNHREILGMSDIRWTIAGSTIKHQSLAPPPLPKGHRFKPTGINTKGTIVGYSFSPTTTVTLPSKRQVTMVGESAQQAWLCLRGRWRKLSPDAKSSAALGINDRNELVGWMAPTGTTHFPMLWRETKPYQLGEQEGEAKAINAHSAIVGYTRQESRWLASLWQDGQPAVLESRLPTSAKLPLYDAVAINDKGQILESRGYLLTPTG